MSILGSGETAYAGNNDAVEVDGVYVGTIDTMMVLRGMGLVQLTSHSTWEVTPEGKALAEQLRR